MSRLDVSSEPSMEDILASIRKIIAEEPPGSRPLPSLTAQPASPVNSRSPDFRELTPAPGQVKPTFSRAFEPLLPEPTPRASTPAPSALDFPSFEPTLKIAPDKPADKAADPAPTAALAPAPVAAVAVALEPQKVDAAIKSVEDQLADLLDDKPAAPIPAAPAAAQMPEPMEAPAQVSKGLDFASMLLGRGQSAAAPAPAPEPAREPEPVQEPSFTVSRAGYIPVEPATKAADPFDFDLGPSPFEKTKAMDAPAPAPAPIAEPAPAAVEAVTQRIDIDEIVTAVLDSRPTLDALTLAPPAPAPAAEASASAQPIAEPVSTAVTRPGWAKVTEIAPEETIAPSSNTSAPDVAPMSVVQPIVAAVVQEAAAVQVDASQNERSMEDTVADLLRPMLRNWLQENMPKIVERALIREMNEQNLIARKTAAE